MAFDPDEILTIAKILRTTKTLLNAHITALGATVDADLEAAVRTELARWTDSGGTFVTIEPTESNLGVRIDNADTQGDIRSNVALLLEWPYPVWSTMGTLQIGN